MSVLQAIGLAACVAAVVIASLRWLRVAQREHYLPGSTLRFSWRWWGRNAMHRVALLLAAVGAALSARWPATVFIAVAVLCFGPRGLSIRGRTSKLHWTRRLLSLAVVAGAIDALVIASVGVSVGLRYALVCAALVALFSPAIVDLSCVLVHPLEEYLAKRYVRDATERMSRIKPVVVGITGSYGKTSTKVYLAHLLSGRYSVLASPRSFNNRAGLARTVNERLVPGTEVLIAEMGAYGPGEIAAVCAWLPPQIAVITAIGPVHLERFKSLDRTLDAKSEITKAASTVVLNVDDPRLDRLATRLAEENEKKVITCSASREDVDVAVLGGKAGRQLVLSGEVLGPIEGGEDAAPTNLACSIAVALQLGCSPSEVLGRLSSLPTPEHRLTATTSDAGVVVLDDTFNSNPAGARLALSSLAARSLGAGRRVLITPGMVELGPMQYEENASFAREAAAIADVVVVVNETNRKALLSGLCFQKGAIGRSAPEVIVKSTRDQAISWVRANLGADDAVLYENDLPDHFP